MHFEMNSFFRWVGKGYKPSWPSYSDVELKETHSGNDSPSFTSLSEIWLLLTTHIYGSNQLDVIMSATRYIDELIAAARVDPKIIGFIAIQYRDYPEKLEAQERARLILEISSKKNVALNIITLKSFRKQDSINTVVSLVNKRGASVANIGWFDDDVLMEVGCISKLIHAARRYPNSAVGAHKIGICRNDLGSRLVYLLKQFSRPAMNYPHGCAIVVPWRIIECGIPSHFASDDGYVCFELLQPGTCDPYARLKIIPEAVVRHFVGAGPGRNATRIKRMLLNHWILMCYYPEKASCYLQTSLFWGLWPITSFASNHGLVHGLIRWFVKALYFSLFCLVGAELVVRGVIGKPLKQYGWV